MSLTLDHIGYAVRDMDSAIAHYKRTLGFDLQSRETLTARGIEIAFLQLANTRIELLMGVTEGNPISKFVENHGEGLHHVCYEVPDIRAELEKQRALGSILIDEVPRPGAHGTEIAFLHPKSFMGVLTELCQYTRS